MKRPELGKIVIVSPGDTLPAQREPFLAWFDGVATKVSVGGYDPNRGGWLIDGMLGSVVLARLEPQAPSADGRPPPADALYPRLWLDSDMQSAIIGATAA